MARNDAIGCNHREAKATRPELVVHRGIDCVDEGGEFR
jgi:hypothetical protein